MRGDARPALGQAHPMILTELGLHFVRDGDRWRCGEYPDLVMLRGGGYEVDGQGLDTLAGALAKTEPSAVRLPEA